MAFNLMKITQSVAPNSQNIAEEIIELRNSNSGSSNRRLAEKYISRHVTKYTSFGVASALPGTIPVLGTTAQIAVEAGTVSGDLLLMLRWMASICYGVGYIHGKDMSKNFNQEFILVLGQWCGVIKAAQKVTEKIGTKVAVAQFNRHIAGKILQKINQKVGTTIFTKFGTKRGLISIGRLIPFGVGAVVGGGFNYLTMKGFGKAALKHYGSDNEDFTVVE